MSKGHYTGTVAASNMRTGPGSGKSAGMLRAAPNKMAAKVGGGRASGMKMTVGSKSKPSGMKIEREGE